MDKDTQLIKHAFEGWLRDLDKRSDKTYGYDNRNDAGFREDEGRLINYWRAVRKHLVLVIGLAVFVTTLATIYTFRKPDIYEAHGRVQVDLERVNPALGASKDNPVIVGNSVMDPAYFNTQVQNLTNPSLLRRAGKKLNLQETKDLLDLDVPGSNSFWQRTKDLFSFGGAKKDIAVQTTAAVPNGSVAERNLSEEDPQEAQQLAPYVEALVKRLEIEPVRESSAAEKETRLIDISFTHSNPRFAANVVNAIIDEFTLSNMERKTESNTTTAHFLSQRITELQAQIRSSEQQLLDYAKSHKILSLDANQNMVVERLAGLNKQLLEAENDRKLAEAEYKASLAPGASDALSEGRTNEGNARSISDIQVKLAELRQRRAQLLVDNTEKWPEVRELNQQIKALEDQIKSDRNRGSAVIVKNLETRYRQTRAREDALRAAYTEQTKETLTQNEAAVNYKILQREIDTNKSLMEGLLQRSKENDVVLAGTPNNIRVIDHAIVPYKPIGPKRLLNILLALILSLGLGVALALIVEYLDDSLSGVEDVEKWLHLPVFALIPAVGPTKKRHLLTAGNGQPSQNGKGDHRPELLMNNDARSSLAEAYKHLRTSILLSTAEQPPQTLLVTSSFPSEGKTSTSINTAISLSQTGAKVLIVDADMRRPQLREVFDLEHRGGLSAILSSKMSESEILSMIDQTSEEGLHVLTAGQIPPNPAELLASSQMPRLIEVLRSTFQYIVIDSPPIASFTDGVLVSSVVDGVLLVVHSGKSSRSAVRRAQRTLQAVGARICGVVLNNVKLQPFDSYYYQQYYHRGYYTAETGDQAA
jgi:polysaccharide biosynthesis transport protein